MNGLIDWAASHARMVIAFVILSLVVGAAAYVGLPKEGEPDIDIPGLFVSVPFPGISAEDSERQLIRPMEAEFQDLDGLVSINATAAEGYAGIFLEFEFGWDKSSTIADVRDAMNAAQADFPSGAENYSISEINFSEFPIIIVALSGEAPERTLIQLANEMQDRLEALPPILEAGLAGTRDELLEVVIDPLALEAYNVTAQELINAVTLNNQLIAAGEVSTDQGAIAVRIPSSFDTPEDVYSLPIKVNGDRVVTLGDLADIRLTFEDRAGTARFNGQTTVALQVVKRQGFNVIDTADLVRAEVEAIQAEWPRELQDSVHVTTTLDQSEQVGGMVRQLEGSVLTAVALVMIVVLAALGMRSALLVGFAIPTSFLLCFILLGLMGVAISNIVMFGLILAVGMLVDGAIVVVEYADKRLSEGARPMQSYTDAAKRMFWPIVASTATTLCAFLPMLFWPGVAGEFMGMLPVTLIFVLMASLIVALIYLPVVGGVAARFTRLTDRGARLLKALVPWWWARALITVGAAWLLFMAAMSVINPSIIGVDRSGSPLSQMAPGAVLFVLASVLLSICLTSVQRPPREHRPQAGYRRTPFGWFVHLIVGNPVMPVVTLAAVGAFVVSVFIYFGQNNNGVEFFVETEPENAIVYVRARGNLSVSEMDRLVGQVEQVVLGTEGVRDVFAFSGDGGLNNNTGGAAAPEDTIGQVQMDFHPWGQRPDGNDILDGLRLRLAEIPGIETEIFAQAQGPADGKPVALELTGDDWAELQDAARIAHAYFDDLPGLTLTEDTLPLPGIDWQLNVDVEAAGRYGANVATVGAMVQLITRGILLDTMRVPSSDDEIEIRVRFPEDQRVLSTLETLRVRTADGLVPLTNFVSWEPARQLATISRLDQSRILHVRADIEDGLFRADAGGEALGLLRALPEGSTGGDWTGPDGTEYEIHSLSEGVGAAALRDADGITLVPVTPTERIERITEWLTADDNPLPASVGWNWGGDQEDQAESQAFLGQAFGAALGLMFIILLAQFNSVYNAVLVLIAVVLSTTGVLIGMLVMDQTFSIIMTGTGIVALAGIVVNNNIVLIDTYQEYARYMPAIEAVTRTAEARIRPVLLTTSTTMAGLAPMMFGISLDFAAGGYTIDSPTAMWWKQLATAVVFGLGVATVLTLVVTPSLLALRAWAGVILGWLIRGIGRLGARRVSARAQDWMLARQARRTRNPTIFWDERPADDEPEGNVIPPSGDAPPPAEAQSTDPLPPDPARPLRAAE
ncbi:AcrB/AcrD/AcrF family protein [Rhodobacterales bacterium HKCCE2091]|nr:AcrB/AcrD/AcrF family protein [Rhodobacterales bacterium HKCCE2091]